MTPTASIIARTSEHLSEAIDAAVASHEPFAYIRFVDAFPPDVYSAMLEAMPAREDYRRMSGRAKADVRTKLDLFPEWIANLPAEKRGVWEVVGKSLR